MLSLYRPKSDYIIIMSLTPSIPENSLPNRNIFADYIPKVTVFRPPTWFYCDEQSFLVSQMVSVWWNVKCLNDETFKTQVSLTNGVIINIFGQNRDVFASQCLGLKANFKDNNFDSKLDFKL